MGELSLDALDLSGAIGRRVVGLARAGQCRLNVVTSFLEVGLELLSSFSMPRGFAGRDVDERLEIGGGSGGSLRGALQLARQTLRLLMRCPGLRPRPIQLGSELVRPVLVFCGLMEERLDPCRQPG